MCGFRVEVLALNEVRRVPTLLRSTMSFFPACLKGASNNRMNRVYRKVYGLHRFKKDIRGDIGIIM